MRSKKKVLGAKKRGGGRTGLKKLGGEKKKKRVEEHFLAHRGKTVAWEEQTRGNKTRGRSQGGG